MYCCFIADSLINIMQLSLLYLLFDLCKGFLTVEKFKILQVFAVANKE